MKSQNNLSPKPRVNCFDSELAAPGIIERLIQDGGMMLKQNELERFVPTYIKSQTIEVLRTLIISEIGKYDNKKNEIEEPLEEEIPRPCFDSF
jgi:hypothetical protein